MVKTKVPLEAFTADEREEENRFREELIRCSVVGASLGIVPCLYPLLNARLPMGYDIIFSMGVAYTSAMVALAYITGRDTNAPIRIGEYLLGRPLIGTRPCGESLTNNL